MKFRFAWPLTTLALLATSMAGASTLSGDFAARGAGAVSCATYTDARTRKLPVVGAYMSYIDGYLTAANRYEPDTFDLTPFHNPPMLALILDKYCKEHAQDNLAVALLRLAAAMRPLRLTETSQKVEVVDGTNRASVYVAVIKNAQTALTRKNLYKGPADGKYSPEMKSALLAFQKQSKLPPSGIPDPATLWVLLNP